MPGGKPAEAVNRFLSTLQLALSCVEDTKIVVSPNGYTLTDAVHSLTTSSIPLTRTADAPLQLELALRYRIVERSEKPRDERFKVQTTRYQHHVLDADGNEVVLFHWHPEAGKSHPHLHVNGFANSDPITRRAHIPSGRVTIESILRFALDDLAVIPNRDDWADTLDNCEGDFTRFKTW